MSHCVHNLADRVDAVTRAVAIVQPDQVAGCEVCGKTTVKPVTALAVARSIDNAVVQIEVGHPTGIGPGSGWDRGAGPCGRHSSRTVNCTYAHLRGAVDGLEPTANDDAAPITCHNQSFDQVIRRRCPRLQRAVGATNSCKPSSRDSAYREEIASGVHRC